MAPDRSTGVQQGRVQDWTDGIPVETEVRGDDVLHLRGSDWLRVRRELNELRAGAVSPEPRPAYDPEKEVVVPFTWDGLVGTVEAILDEWYPDALFTGESGDKGAVFVVALREALTGLRGPEPKVEADNPSVARELRLTASRLRDPEYRWSVDPAVTLERLAERLEDGGGDEN